MGMYPFRDVVMKRFRRAVGLEKPEIEQGSPAGSSLSAHIRADSPEELAEYLQKSGNQLSDLKSSENEIRATERAHELLAGEVATEADMLDLIDGMLSQRGTRKAVAAELGISPAFLTDMMLGKRSVGGKAVMNMGWEKVTVFRKR
jgi:hypothetical protein